MNKFFESTKCEFHQCPMIQVTAQALPVCLIEWLMEHYLHRRVVDVVPVGDRYGDLVLENSMLLPVIRLWAMDKRKLKPLWDHPKITVQLAVLSALRLLDVAYQPPRQNGADHLLLKFAVSNIPGALVFGEAKVDALMSLLHDAEMRKYEPRGSE